MKLKNLLTTLGLTLAVGIGVAVGAGGQKGLEVKKAEAITLEDDMTFYYIDNWGLGTPYFYEFDGSNNKPVAWPGVAMNDTGNTFEYAEGQSAKVFSFTADASTYPNFIINDNSSKQTKDMQWSWYSALNGNAFLHVSDDGESLSITDYAAFSIVVDSVETPLVRNWDNTEAAEYKLATDKAFDPAKPIAIERNGEAYAFTMKADIDNNYNNGEIVDSKIVVHNAAITNLYLNADTQQVWVGGFEFDATQNIDIYLIASGYGDLYMYTYEYGATSKAMGVYPGTKMTSYSGLGYKYAGQFYGIYKAVFPGESSDDIFIFSDGGDVNKREISRTDLANGDYTANLNAAGTPGGRTGAFDALIRLQELLAAIPANDVAETVQGSTCGITQAYAQTIVDEMGSLTSSIVPYAMSELEASTIYLVSKKDGSEHANYTYAEIMTAINSVAAGSSRVMKIAESNNTTMLLAAIISSAALVSIGGFFLLKKKKEN